MEFVRVQDRNIRGFSFSRSFGQGFIVDNAGLIRFQRFESPARREAVLWLQDYQDGILLTEGYERNISLNDLYQLDVLDSFFMRLMHVGLGNQVQFNFQAPTNIRINREERKM